MQTLVITRAEHEAQPWLQALAARGWPALALPLIAIHAVTDSAPLLQAWRQRADYRAMMFVSANALRGFQQALPAPVWRDDAQAAGAAPRVWVTGAASARAALAAGVPAKRLDQPDPARGQWDSEALWEVVAAQVQAGQRVLIVRGAGADGAAAGRDWLTRQLQAHGVQVDTVCAYQRHLPRWTDVQAEQARRGAADGTIWLFSSSEAVRNLPLLLPGVPWGAATCLATHARIAQTCRDIGFGRVQLTRPEPEAVMASIESLHHERSAISRCPT